MNIFIKDTNDFKQKIGEIKNNLSDGWDVPEDGIVSDDAYDIYYIFQYKGDEFKGALLHINKKPTNGKHIISISPIGKKNEFTTEEHDKVLNHFMNTMKNIDIEFGNL